MKRILSLVLAVALLCCCVFALTSCGNFLFGKYETEVAGVYTKTYEFKLKEFTCVRTIGGFSHTATGTYEITEDDEGNTYISFTYGENADEDAKEEEGVKLSFSKGTEDGVKYIKIAGVKYTAVK